MKPLRNIAPPPELHDAFVRRPRDANKRSVGMVAVVGGSSRFVHAPVIAALGARAAGAGLVQLVVPDASKAAAAALVPEATFSKLSSTCAAPRADTIVIGMGLGISATAEAIVSRIISGSRGRFVVDADALSILASWQGHANGFSPAEGQELILTPHEGEAARLLGWSAERIHADRPAAAKKIVGLYGATVVLKGPETIVMSADGSRVYVNTTGNPAMALGGMGDLLAGVIGARWAYLKNDAFLAAASSTWLHGAASDALVAAAEDPSIVQTATCIGSMRVVLDA